MNFRSLKCFQIHNNQDKIILPLSILDTLMTMEDEVQYPLIFEIITNEKKTHCGVLKFTADEGNCYIPEWIMNNLQIKEGGIIYLRNVVLEKATLVKFKPCVSFLDVSHPQEVLQHMIRLLSCITIGDKLHFEYNTNQYIFEVIDVKPKKACYIEGDIEIELDHDNYSNELTK